jgi:DNA replication protein DnaC
MLANQTIEKIQALKLHGMLKALQEKQKQSDIEDLSFMERLGLLIDRELIERENTKLKTRLSKAKLKQMAAMEDIDYKKSRGLDKSLMLQLSTCNWIKERHNILIVGATGTGKTYLACALANKACLEGYTAYYLRLSRILSELSVAKGDGSYSKRMNELAKVEVLILDDWGLAPFTQEQRRDLLEILDDRYNQRATIITSQLPIKLWHEAINDTTLADAILDRLIHNSYRIELKGEDSMRKIYSKLTIAKEVK